MPKLSICLLFTPGGGECVVLPGVAAGTKISVCGGTGAAALSSSYSDELLKTSHELQINLCQAIPLSAS